MSLPKAVANPRDTLPLAMRRPVKRDGEPELDQLLEGTDGVVFAVVVGGKREDEAVAHRCHSPFHVRGQGCWMKAGRSNVEIQGSLQSTSWCGVSAVSRRFTQRRSGDSGCTDFKTMSLGARQRRPEPANL